MADKPELVAGHNWRVDDAKAIYGPFTAAASMIGASDIGPTALARRLRLIGAWFAMAADHMDERDTEADGMAEADQFWQRHGIDSNVRYDGPKREPSDG